MYSLSETTRITLFYLRLHFLIFLCITIAVFPQACHGCREQERRALLDFKLSVSDPSNRLSSWQDGIQHENCCHWHGIECSRDNHVIVIDLWNTELEMHYLEDPYGVPPNTAIHDDVYYNHPPCLHISSTKWVRGLINLQVLKLNGNNLSMATSSQKEFYLDISQCYISTTIFPIHGFHNLSRLSFLNINVNPLLSSKIPVQIANLTSLSTLHLYRCGLEGSVPYLPQLKVLDVSLNLNLRPDLTRMFQHPWPKLQTLDISFTNVNGSIPVSISNAPLLVTVFANSSSIQGSLPPTIYNLSRLQYLDLSFNNISEYLALPSCNLTGSVPTFVCDLSNLELLNLSHNHLTGAIPSCISKLKNLGTFDISNNNLGGPLPPLPFPPFVKSDMFSFESKSFVVSVFDVSNNKLSGEISIETAKRYTSFRSINLSGNQLSGPIPFSICSEDSQSNPIYIDFSNNKLSGMIPTSIGYCIYLESLNLARNNLIGNVPSELKHAKSLVYLQLHNNNLGGFPLNFIGKLQNLMVLNLANNHFRGNITTLFGSIYMLQILSLRSNNFNGSLPEEVIHLKNLQILDLSRNNLTGFLPRKIGNLIMLISRPNDAYSLNQFLGYSVVSVQLQMVIKGIVMQFEKLYTYSSGVDLSCNALEGNIPYEIGLLQGLSTLNLSHNHFSGIIPKSVGNMSGLESLDLSFNKLSGNIPQSLVSVRYLGYLNLSYNNLSGRIPREAHFDTLSGDGSAYLNNSLLCGFYTNHTCEGDRRSNVTDSNPPNESYQDDKEDAKEKFLLYAIVALGFGVGFWGLFLVLLLKKEKWWFGYWRLVDVVALRVANICCKF
ncbi:hypothetical protein MKW92_005718 [Papaver armeniacum]|nr:hypothetical protein MKW92_005718 [Papaver armeniacum]